MKYKINDREMSYHASGDKISGDKIILINEAVDLTSAKSWSEKGYTVEKLFSESVFKEFENKTRKLLLSLWKSVGLYVADNLELDRYHQLASTQPLHLAAVEKTKLLSIADFPISITTIENRISEICETRLVAKNPFDNQSVFHFRVVRPNSHDNNPLHRDVWLEDYANCINLYIPIAGSNELSSLPIIPGSHRWPENKTERTNEGATVDGVKFNVPAVTGINEPYELVRPNPKRNEVLVFSPYLIHGGAVNLNPDQTRISIELRLWKDN